MQYVQHDFLGNIVMLQKTGQQEKAREVLVKEISQLIIYHRGHVIQCLNKAGVPTNKYAGDTELIDKLVDNLPTNKALQAGIGHWLIALNSPQPFYGAAGDDREGPRSGGAKGFGGAAANTGTGAATGGALGAIAGALGSAFNFFSAKQDAKTQAEANKMALAQALLSNQPAKKTNTALYVGVAAVIIVGGIVTFMLLKKKPASPAMEYGGTMAASQMNPAMPIAA